jgi:hypothetical protein
MNLINGNEVVKLLKTLSEYNRINIFPIVIVTAQKDKLTESVIKEQVPLKIVYKPLTVQILRENLSELKII